MKTTSSLTDFKIHQKQCLQQQTRLRAVLMDPQDFPAAIQLFLDQHAMLHSARMEPKGLWSFEDALLDDLSPDQMHSLPGAAGHSIAWIVWHIARCEDITFNLLVGGVPQVLLREGWLPRLNIRFCDTGNEMTPAELAEFHHSIDTGALREYRVAVGRSTREIVRALRPTDLKRKADPGRIRQIIAEGAVVDSARYLTDYWAKRDVTGLLLMPATRHPLVHFNEALEVKKRL